jgi:uncharacterized Rmd1/YagE family protein
VASKGRKKLTKRRTKTHERKQAQTHRHQSKHTITRTMKRTRMIMDLRITTKMMTTKAATTRPRKEMRTRPTLAISLRHDTQGLHTRHLSIQETISLHTWNTIVYYTSHLYHFSTQQHNHHPSPTTNRQDKLVLTFTDNFKPLLTCTLVDGEPDCEALGLSGDANGWNIISDLTLPSNQARKFKELVLCKESWLYLLVYTGVGRNHRYGVLRGDRR